MTVINVTEARKNLYNLVDLANESHETILISGKRGNAVLISEEDWSAINETLYLLSIPKMRESIKKGLETPVDECDTDLDW
ncbi:MAG: type II toxin-antitoxin system Phd/YefM family antitoxin [Candidatus Delongbacteria bacterium]|jgi:antitoxin YefM